jgi:hypothetical protein
MSHESERIFLIATSAGDTDLERFVADHDRAAADDFQQAFRERFGYLPFSHADQQLDPEIIDRCLQTGHDILLRVVSGRVERYR